MLYLSIDTFHYDLTVSLTFAIPITLLNLFYA
eukprot:SAG22_NODE_4317_length_1307_cov_0.955298_1_plen_31_part_10